MKMLQAGGVSVGVQQGQVGLRWESILKKPSAGSQTGPRLPEQRVGSESCSWHPKVGRALLPQPKRPVIVKIDDIRRLVGRHIQHLKPLLHLALDELRSPLVALVGVLLEDGQVVFLRALAAFEHQED